MLKVQELHGFCDDCQQTRVWQSANNSFLQNLSVPKIAETAHFPL
jgi:hypothetical protein